MNFFSFLSKNAPWAVLLFSLPIFADWKVQKKKGGHPSFPSLLHFFWIDSLFFFPPFSSDLTSQRKRGWIHNCLQLTCLGEVLCVFWYSPSPNSLNLVLHQKLPTKILINVHVLHTGIFGFSSLIFAWNRAPCLTARTCVKQDPRRGEQMIYSSALSLSCSSCCQIQTGGRPQITRVWKNCAVVTPFFSSLSKKSRTVSTPLVYGKTTTKYTYIVEQTKVCCSSKSLL